MKKNVACYVRVSTLSQTKEDKYSIPEQREILQQICKKNNWKSKFYEDLGISGESIKGRPDFKKLLQDCMKGFYIAVLVVDQDRLSRNVGDLQEIKDIFRSNGIKLITQTAQFDFDDEDDDFITDINGVIGKREIRVIAKRSARGKYQKAKQGKMTTGGNNIIYGYKLDEEDRLVIDKEEAEIVKQIFDLLANKGYSCYKIADKLNSLCIPTRLSKFGRKPNFKVNVKYKNTQWTRSTVNHIVRKKIYYQDKYIYGQKSKYKNIQPTSISKEPIISKDIYQKAHKQLSQNKSYHGDNKATAVYILTGKLRCLKCNNSYVGGRWNSGKYGPMYYYRDLGRSARSREFNFKCNSASLRKELIENVIKNDIKLFLLNPETMNKYLDEKNIKNTKTDEEFRSIRTKIEKKNEEINRLLDLYSLNSLPKEIKKSNISEIINKKNAEIQKLKDIIDEMENGKEISEIREKKVDKFSIIAKQLSIGIEKLNDLEWKRIVDKLIENIGVESLGGKGKTEKLDLYVIYNFDKVIEEKGYHFTNYLCGASKRSP